MTFKYTGYLSKALPAPPLALLQDDDDREKVLQLIDAAKYGRMKLLFQEHHIPYGNWEALCFALAEAHVPGLRVADKRAGRPRKWDWIRQAELRIAVDRIVEQQAVTVAEATRQLAEIEPWKSLVAHARGADTLRDEYTRADVGVVKQYRNDLADALRKHQTSDSTARK